MRSTAETKTIDDTVVTPSTLAKDLRWKRVYSSFLLFASFVFGWIYSMMGPAILDLQETSGVSFSLASLYFMWINIGHAVGSLGCGILYGKINSYLLIIVAIAGLSLTEAIIPWCASFATMAIAHLSQGIFGGTLDSVSVTEMAELWGSNVNSPMEALFFSYTFGGILSPFCVSPYLKDAEIESAIYNRTQVLNTNSSTNETTVRSTTIDSIEQDDGENHSYLYIPYSFSSVLTILSAIPFIIILFKNVFHGFRIAYVDETFRTSKEMSMVLRLFTLACVGIIFAVAEALEESTSYFLASFSVSRVQWTKQNGAYATAIFNGSCTFGRLIGIAEAIYLSPQTMLTYHSFLVIVVVTTLLASAHFMLDIGIWICTAMIGLSLSVITPSVISLTEYHFFPVTGKIVSYFVIIACIGSVINSSLIGYLMDTYSPLSFAYVLLSDGMIIVCFVLLILYQIRVTNNEPESNNTYPENFEDISNDEQITHM